MNRETTNALGTFRMSQAPDYDSFALSVIAPVKSEPNCQSWEHGDDDCV